MANTDTISLQQLPSSEAELDSWVRQLTQAINAEIREHEVGADQYCWRLSIQGKHYLLFYSELCIAAWLEPLENLDNKVLHLLEAAGYVTKV
ncbi:DUF3630 family protein [Idiomarina seosinensis]|uniref:DUF3630 domain-containing protein n=1 Tax=Idiomarina seosinensis TaxID=281739 RepID=A0A432Z6W1_9GAMM|nr:DUF3630 family protein [Idiomarina seosinensis]RUO73559.1 DUF3630 domain-containing protein [Idiomarina seosinensis]